MNANLLLTHFDRIADAPDAVPRLRRFVLDLAVRGRLVPQEPDDEPASELVKRIAAEKARLVKAGGIRKGNLLPAIAIDEAPFKIPAEWCWVKFGDITAFSAGRTPPRNEPAYWNTGDYPWVSIADMRDGETLTATRETVSEESAKHIFRSEPEHIGTMIMSFKLTIGKVARLGIPAYHNEAIISIRPYVTEIDSYLFKALPLFAQQSDTKGAVKGATLNRESLANIPISLPPFAEQHRIVAKVDELIALCDRLETARTARETTRNRLAAASLARLNAPDPDPAAFRKDAVFALDTLTPLTTRPGQIKALRQTILNLAVRGKLVPQDPDDEPAPELLKKIAAEKARLVKAGKIRKRQSTESATPNEWAFGLPSGWAVTKFSDVLIELQTGPFGSSLHQNDYEIGGTPVINPASMQDGKIVPAEKMAVGENTLERLATFKLQAGDIVMGRRGEMGRCAVVTEKEDGWLCGTGSLILRLPDNFYPSYLAMLIGSPHVREYLGGSAVGATMQNLNQSILLKMSIGLPPLAEQHRIVAKVDELMALCDHLEATLAVIDETRGRLLESVLHEALEMAADGEHGHG